VTDMSKNSMLTGVAAALLAAALLLGPGLRTSNAEDASTGAVSADTEASTGSVSAKSEDSAPAPAPAMSRTGKSKYAAVGAAGATANTSEAAPKEQRSDGLPPPAAADKPSHGGRFFVDFRARTAASYGHAFLWYGRLKEDGRVGAVEVAGLHPATDSVVPYILGHLIPVPAETGKSYGDLDEQYLTASYRVYLTEAQAKHVFAYIRQKQASSPLWQAGTVNCTGFIADVANYMGLRTPALPTLMYPENLVKEIKKLNGGRQEMPAYASASH
jgi:hypothetical protein